MRREGSALHGFSVVTLKEIADHFTSILVVVLVVLIVATAVAAKPWRDRIGQWLRGSGDGAGLVKGGSSCRFSPVFAALP